MREIIAEPRTFVRPDLLDRIVLLSGDLVAQDADAIVAAIPETLELKDVRGRAIVTAAGAELDEAILENIYRPRPGDVFALPGFKLRARHVIFAVVPNWQTEFECEDRHLLACYRGAVQVSVAMGLKTLAFPGLLFPGNRGFPPRRAVRLAIRGIMDRMEDSLQQIRIVCENPDVATEYRERLIAVRNG